MSGEQSKKSGEHGEKLAEAFLKAIGWRQEINSITITCTNESHLGSGGKQKKTHGDDRVFIYNNPFYESRTDIVHVSVKNNSGGYPKTESPLRRNLKRFLLEANEIIACAQYDTTIHELVQAFSSRRRHEHSGLLIWTSSHNESFDRDVLSLCAPARGFDDACIHNVYLVDGARINFILAAIGHADLDKNATRSFYFPDTGLVNKSDERHGNFLPLELVVADMLPLKIVTSDRERLHLYVRQPFGEEAYSRAIGLALTLTGGWGREVRIGFPDYNESQHAQIAAKAKLPFNNRQADISVFRYLPSNLSALETN